MAQQVDGVVEGNVDFVVFCAAGEPAKGEYHCADCGYGVTVHRALPVCPMCGGSTWEQTPWCPFTRATTTPL